MCHMSSGILLKLNLIIYQQDLSIKIIVTYRLSGTVILFSGGCKKIFYRQYSQKYPTYLWCLVLIWV